MYVQQLDTFKHDIAERHCCFRIIVHDVLQDDPDGFALLISCRRKVNPVKMIRVVIEYCLQSEERAERFLEVVRNTNPPLYDDLTTRGPHGKFGE